jgi:3-deoxy-D-manno-octulosonic-acid transferase
MALVNGRMSESSFKRWRLMKSHVAPLLAAFRVVLAQDETQASRFRGLGATQAKYVGNLKYAAPPLPVDEAAYEALRQATAGRPVWLAASTHPGEEAIVATAHARLKPRFPRLLTIVVPRHPDRGVDVAALFDRRGLRVARRSAGETLSSIVEVYVADGIGELGLFYRLAPVALVGGSLVPHGGHNPLEPAQLSSAILCGPHSFNFAAICERLAGAGGLRHVADADELADAVGFLLSDEVGRCAMTLDAARIARAEAHVLDAVMHALDPLLASAAPAEAAGARA